MVGERTDGGRIDGPFEGVPRHLRNALLDWWAGLGDKQHRSWWARRHEVNLLVAHLHYEVPWHWETHEIVQVMLQEARSDEQFFLELVDGTLHVFDLLPVQVDALTRLLRVAGSVWTVAPDYRSLIRVVTDEIQSSYATATAVPDEASKELAEAWSNAFGRDGNPSDAWDHAIKAVEDVLIPAVMPNKLKANLGSVLGELAGQNSPQWKLLVPGNNQDHDVAPLVAMLRLIWPNHDRHGGATKQPPTEQQARAVVTLAATIVQWDRQGWVVARR